MRVAGVPWRRWGQRGGWGGAQWGGGVARFDLQKAADVSTFPNLSSNDNPGHIPRGSSHRISPTQQKNLVGALHSRPVPVKLSGSNDKIQAGRHHPKISNSYQKKELRNDTARGSTAGFGGTGVCVGVRFVSLPSGRARGFNGDEW